MRQDEGTSRKPWFERHPAAAAAIITAIIAVPVVRTLPETVGYRSGFVNWDAVGVIVDGVAALAGAATVWTALTASRRERLAKHHAVRPFLHLVDFKARPGSGPVTVKNDGVGVARSVTLEILGLDRPVWVEPDFIPGLGANQEGTFQVYFNLPPEVGFSREISVVLTCLDLYGAKYVHTYRFRVSIMPDPYLSEVLPVKDRFSQTITEALPGESVEVLYP